MTVFAIVDAIIREQADSQPAPRTTFAEALEALYTSRFTGRVYLDFAEGVPKALAIPNPIGVQLRN